MLRRRRVAFSLAGLIGAVIVTSVFLGFSGIGQTEQQQQRATVLRRGAPMANQSPPQPSAKELDDAATPIVDLNDTNRPDADRAMKNARFDKYGLVRSDLDPRDAEVSITSHWQDDISDLPSDKSDLVIEGRVTESAAFLSNDKGAVYSEFTVRVSDVLKTSSGVTVGRGDSIVTERLGGRVRYPDGKVVRYNIAGQGSPMKGKKYLFFLSKTQQGNYKIVTGYELQGNKVIAIDGSRINRHGLGGWAFDKHNDEDYRDFREAVGRAIKNPPTPNREKGVGP